ncbi:hypothetical protein LCM00_12725 [Bacillus infantis]|uniref:hypothetical protein n=1 Tax=Bacillus infantis TaxID=324767 RepID=UPI001CD266C4|nr:hypothetical protein [Bacillus infantis]MCA1040370.1 hypothetical protein [Bacillus infantis]
MDNYKGGKAAKNHWFGISFFLFQPYFGQAAWRPRPHLLLSIWQLRKPAQHIDLLKPRDYGQIPQRHIKQINLSGIYLSLKFPHISASAIGRTLVKYHLQIKSYMPGCL